MRGNIKTKQYQILSDLLKGDINYFFIEELGSFLHFQDIKIDSQGKIKVILK